MTQSISRRHSRNTAQKSAGLALGGGGARGWAEVGALEVLAEAGFRPEMIAGTSVGAIVGAAFAAGRLDRVVALARELDWKKTAALFLEVGFPKMGLTTGRRVEQFLAELIGAERFEDLKIPFAAVCTNLASGEEVVINSGRLIPAIRASISIPGIFAPVSRGSQQLIDGALANPLPVSAVRAMGADFTVGIDVNLAPGLGNAELRGKTHSRASRAENIFEVLTRATRIMENATTRARLVTEAPEILVQPPVGDVPTLDFFYSAPLIAAGREAMREKLELIEKFRGAKSK